MSKLRRILIVSALLTLAVACSGGGGSGGGSATGNLLRGDWVDANNDGVYDAYQNQSTWSQMNGFRSAASSVDGLWGPRPAFAAPMRGWGGMGNMGPAWMDANHDGIADYAQSPSLWSQYHQGPWYDNNGDGICDNYPNSGRWGNGWR
ncbi:MAG: hypothetical protein C4525_16840 [Desulfarculus sp.]|jgi:hypothetical protein|nr:MAG: hypothetical protein C4525_16840 [Desulfarculus sp.]